MRLSIVLTLVVVTSGVAVAATGPPVARTTIVSSSMEPTLPTGATVRVDRSIDPAEVARGDIVVFDDPGPWRAAARDHGRPEDDAAHLAKRVLGVGGDELWCCDRDGRIVLAGEPLDEPYLAPGTAPSTVAFRARVPAGHLWLMGDNRDASIDSRHLRPVPGAAYVPVNAVVGTIDP